MKYLLSIKGQVIGHVLVRESDWFLSLDDAGAKTIGWMKKEDFFEEVSRRYKGLILEAGGVTLQRIE